MLRKGVKNIAIQQFFQVNAEEAKFICRAIRNETGWFNSKKKKKKLARQTPPLLKLYNFGGNHPIITVRLNICKGLSYRK